MTRSFSLALPVRRSQVHLTSAAVNGLPSCHLTPWRSGKVSSVPSSFHDQLVARSGMIDCRLACATCWSYMTKLLKTCIIGCSAALVDSSRIDMLAGLSKCDSLKIPPLFCACGRPGSRHCRQQSARSDYISNPSGHSRFTSHCTRRDWLTDTTDRTESDIRKADCGSPRFPHPTALPGRIRQRCWLRKGKSYSIIVQNVGSALRPATIGRARRLPCASRCRCC